MPNRPFLDQRVFFDANPLFANLSDHDRHQLFLITKRKAVRPNHVVVKQGDPGDKMYVILEGKVQVSINISKDEEITLGCLGPSEAFGEIALFDKQERTATVSTLEASEFLILKREPFLAYLTEHPNVAISMLAIMSKRFRKANDFIKDSLYQDVLIRLSDLLNNLAKAYGKNTATGRKIDTEFTNKELAKIAGLPSDVVGAQLKHWKTRGVINVQHGLITIVKPEELLQTD